MREGPLGRHPLVDVHGEESPDQVFGVARNAVPVFRIKAVIALSDLLVGRPHRVFVEGTVPTQDGVHNDTQTPIVDAFVVGFVVDNFGCRKGGGSENGGEALGPGHADRETKVGNLDAGIIVRGYQQQIFRL